MGVKHEYLQTFSFSLYLKWDRGNELDLALLQIQQLKYDLEVSADGVLSMPLGTTIKKYNNNKKENHLSHLKWTKFIVFLTTNIVHTSYSGYFTITSQPTAL